MAQTVGYALMGLAGVSVLWAGTGWGADTLGALWREESFAAALVDLMAFYLPGQPTVYCASSLTGGRRTQYDFWAHTDLNDLEKLGSRPAVMIGADEEQWVVAFDRVERFGQLNGESKIGRQTFIGYGYRGFGPKE